MRMMGSDLPPEKVCARACVCLRACVSRFRAQMGLLLIGVKRTATVRYSLLRSRLLCSQVAQVFKAIDRDGGGSIDAEEFTEW